MSVSSDLKIDLSLRAGATPESLFEAFTGLAVVAALKSNGYSLLSPKVRFDVTNQLPYFVPTAGGQHRRVIDSSEIISRFIPCALLIRETRYLTLHYQGIPTICSRLRPDLSLMYGKLETRTRQGIGHELIEVCLKTTTLDNPVLTEVHTNVLLPSGPQAAVYALRDPIRIPIQGIIETTVSKPASVISQQLYDYRKIFHPSYVIVLTGDHLWKLSVPPDFMKGDIEKSPQGFESLVQELAIFLKERHI